MNQKITHKLKNALSGEQPVTKNIFRRLKRYYNAVPRNQRAAFTEQVIVHGPQLIKMMGLDQEIKKEE